MDYSKMSDKEINREVQKLTGMGCMSGDGVLIVADGRWRRFDPCNNPADAWPIIVENKINIEWHEWKGEEWKSYALNNAMMKSCYDDKPLRAAMTVFLMMQELANVQTDSTR